jgi:hypothetical protein
MESVFDEVQNALAEGVDIEDALLQEKIEILIQYYESEQWKNDYSADERGELPADLKRGVLSEDGVYNLLNDIDSLKQKGWENDESYKRK